jgi:hypothetical protein
LPRVESYLSRWLACGVGEEVVQQDKSVGCQLRYMAGGGSSQTTACCGAQQPRVCTEGAAGGQASTADAQLCRQMSRAYAYATVLLSTGPESMLCRRAGLISC